MDWSRSVSVLTSWHWLFIGLNQFLFDSTKSILYREPYLIYLPPLHPQPSFHLLCDGDDVPPMDPTPPPHPVLLAEQHSVVGPPLSSWSSCCCDCTAFCLLPSHGMLLHIMLWLYVVTLLHVIPQYCFHCAVSCHIAACHIVLSCHHLLCYITFLYLVVLPSVVLWCCCCCAAIYWHNTMSCCQLYCATIGFVVHYARTCTQNMLVWKKKRNNWLTHESKEQ